MSGLVVSGAMNRMVRLQVAESSDSSFVERHGLV